ncbi:MAG: hypothetical protein ABR564_06995, partial [Candidatus Dormibacteria bacterium]
MSEQDLRAFHANHVGELVDFVARVVRDRGRAGDIRAELIVADVFSLLAAPSAMSEAGQDQRMRALRAAHEHSMAAVDRSSDPAGRRSAPVSDEPRWDLDETAPGGDDDPVAAEAAMLVWASAAALRRSQYAVLDLSVRRELGTAAVAAVLHCSHSQATSRIAAARESFVKRVRLTTVTHRWAECARLRMLFPGRPRALTPEQHVVAQRHLARCQGCRVLAGR